MIHKVQRLISIGKFRDYNAAGQVNFLKLTLLFAENGSGKTTVTSVFRSLTTNNPNIIRSRISTNHVLPQAAIVEERNGAIAQYHTFHHINGWNSAMDDIEIFDIHFVNENVYSGFDFNEDQKKELHKFVIGAQGIAFRQQIEQNKADKVACRAAAATLEQQIIDAVGNNLTVLMVSALAATPAAQGVNIDQQIAAAEASLATANANVVINTFQILANLNAINSGIEFTNLKADLETTTKAIQDATLEAIFTEHCLDLEKGGVEGSEAWLKKGFSYVETNLAGSKTESPSNARCPFCSQKIDATENLLKAYALKFNEDFNSLVERIKSHEINVRNFNLKATLQGLTNSLGTNETCIEAWAQHLPATAVKPELDLANETALTLEYNAVLDAISLKLQNPTVAVGASVVTDFETSLQSINKNIASYNLAKTTYNNGIVTFKAGIKTVTVAQLEVDQLHRIKRRFEEPATALCVDLGVQKNNLQALEAAYPGLVQQEEAAATAFFVQYRDRINHYLGAVFRTPFRIEDVNHIVPQGQAIGSKISYRLTIHGHNISFDPAQPFCAKECLSEGDKSTIALAFFLSKLDIDPNRQNKILIFDDPLSSLDTNRRSYTVDVIQQLLPHIKQLVVLSHSEVFLHLIGSRVQAADKNTLRITENFVTNSSVIEACDLDDLVKNDYFKHIEALENFRINPNPAIKDTVLGWLRNVLESHLKFKFYKELRGMNGLKTFGRLITFLDNVPVVFRDNAHRADIIAKLNLINDISWMPHHGMPAPVFPVHGLSPNTLTAAELDNLIVDTLELIEVRI